MKHAPYPDNAGMLWCPACEAPWPECPEYKAPSSDPQVTLGE